MRQTILVLTGVPLCGMSLGSDSPRDYDDSTVNSSVEGNWKVSKIETDGEVHQVSWGDVPHAEIHGQI
jgi:hypothetical protein